MSIIAGTIASQLNTTPLVASLIAGAAAYGLASGYCKRPKATAGLTAGLGAYGIATLIERAIDYVNRFTEIPFEAVETGLRGLKAIADSLGLGGMFGNALNFLETQVSGVKGWLKKTKFGGKLVLGVVALWLILRVSKA